jgi:hypothetical protein
VGVFLQAHSRFSEPRLYLQFVPLAPHRTGIVKEGRCACTAFNQDFVEAQFGQGGEGIWGDGQLVVRRLLSFKIPSVMDWWWIGGLDDWDNGIFRNLDI